MRNGSYTHFNQAMIDKIDNMNEEKDFDPYAPIKKKSIDEEVLFDDKTYKETTDELKNHDTETIETKSIVKVVVSILLIAAFVIGAIMVVKNFA